mgnify:CR=1 FL=1
MKYSNIVRFKPKEGEFENVVNLLSEPMEFEGLLQNFVVKTSDTTCCSVGVWESETHIANARPHMIALLDTIRDKLELISEDVGVTDAVSGPVIQES